MSALRELIMKAADPMDAVLKMGTAVAQSTMFGCSNPPQGIVVILHCMEKGIPLLDWQARFHLVGDDGKKKPSMKAEAMLAAFAESGGKFEWVNDGSEGIVAELKLTKDSRSQIVRYTLEQAERAGLVRKDKPQSNWMARRPEMLRARVISSGLRMFDPSIVVGVYTPEELDDINVGEVAGMDSVTVRGEQASPPSGGEQVAERKPRGRPAGSGMKPKEVAAATEPAASPEASQAEPMKPATEPAKQPETAKPATEPADVHPTDPKAIDTPKLQFDRMMAKVARVKEIWGEKAAINWPKVEAGLGIAPGDPIPEEHREYLEGWCDERIAKHQAAQQGKTLEGWANQAVTK